jgi:hypothetical protein
VARLPGQVATCRADFEHLLVPDLHGAGFRATRLADVPDARAGDGHDARIARFAVIRGDRGGALEGLTVRVGARRTLENGVAPWHPAHVEPPILRPGHLETQKIVVGIGPADQDLPPPWQRVGAQAALLGVRR